MAPCIKVMWGEMKRMDGFGICFRKRTIRLDEWERVSEVMEEREEPRSEEFDRWTLWRWGREQRWETGLNNGVNQEFCFNMLILSCYWVGLGANTWLTLGPSYSLGFLGSVMWFGVKSWAGLVCYYLLNLNWKYWDDLTVNIRGGTEKSWVEENYWGSW